MGKNKSKSKEPDEDYEDGYDSNMSNVGSTQHLRQADVRMEPLRYTKSIRSVNKKEGISTIGNEAVLSHSKSHLMSYSQQVNVSYTNDENERSSDCSFVSSNNQRTSLRSQNLKY